MTIEPVAPTATYTVSGIGPYALPWPYGASTLVAAVTVDGALVYLDDSQFTVDPAESTVSGNFFLTAPTVATYAGRALIITRETPQEQGWQATQGAREAGLESQLDQIVKVQQEQAAQIRNTLRATAALVPFPATASGVLTILNGQVVLIPNPESAVAQAAASAAEAAAAAARAEQYGAIAFDDLLALQADAVISAGNTAADKSIEARDFGGYSILGTDLTLGSFASDLTGWTALGTATWLSAGVAQVVAAGGTLPGRLRRELSGLEIGATYALRVGVLAVSGGATVGRVYVSTTANAGQAVAQLDIAPYAFGALEFVATATTMFILLDTVVVTNGATAQFTAPIARKTLPGSFVRAAHITNALATPLVARIGRDGIITTKQVGVVASASYDAAPKINEVLADLGERSEGGSFLLDAGEFYINDTVMVPPRVYLRGAGRQPLAEGRHRGGSRLRMAAGMTEPGVWVSSDYASQFSAFIRAAGDSGNEGAQRYINSVIEGIVIDARDTTDSRADALRVDRAWSLKIRDNTLLAGRRGFALRSIDCNVNWISDNWMLGSAFFWSLADSIISQNQIGGSGPNVPLFGPAMWLAGNDTLGKCWKNILGLNMAFNNTSNIGHPSWTFTASGETLNLSAAHDFNDGDPVALDTTGTLPTGVSLGLPYFVKRLSATTVKLAGRLTDVAAGPYLSLSAGSGTHTILGGASANLFLHGATDNGLSNSRYDQGVGHGVLFRGASRNSLTGGICQENGLNGAGKTGIRLEAASNGNSIQGVALSGNINQTIGVFEDATCSGNMIDVQATGHSAGNVVRNSRQVESVFLGTDRLEAISGSPSIGLIGGGRRNAWLMDAASEEAVGVEFALPSGWEKVRIVPVWVNTGAGAGNVTFAWNAMQIAVGATVNVADAFSSLERTFTANTQDVLIESPIVDLLTVTGADLLWLRVKRAAAAASDTLANDIGLIGVRIERAS